MGIANFRATDTGTATEATSVNVTRTMIGDTMSITTSASNQQTAPLPDGTRAVRIVATADAWIDIGPNPNATANPRTFVPAGAAEYFDARVGDRVAAVQVSGSGSVHVRATN